ncbi:MULTISPECIES: hypothetical protein [Bacillus cereus group]|uniref:Uncharacterized protein n=1 Tax=Bacillus cereus TaxID=1396 RepID=A0A9X6ZE66_BACCE|nr:MULTISPECIES: hypothetical protein [Bacillus cereus group]MED0951653.1 hypothetical protein [Bacillus mobilis]PFF46148.1 hypothetical protein CN357_22145 [Bacillus cereus]PFQ30183.1 hypothetical protein COK33_28430 [Bacillus cereus]PGB15604.1 hypothetical protein COM09_08280 [Bacillus toyonensis]
METKQINDFINSVMGSNEFQRLQQEVTNQIINKMKYFPFESEDDVRLVSARLRDSFYLSVNYQVSKRMISLMGEKKYIKKTNELNV